MTKKHVIFVLALVSSGLLEAQAPGVQVFEVLAARDVLARQPVEPAQEFPSDVGSVVCWSRVQTDETPASFIHVWFYEGRETARITLNVAVANVKWRTWSRKRILPTQPGNWRVEVQNEDGAILGLVNFVIK